MGSAPNAAATATVSHPVKQGLIQALSVFTDTIVICSCTAFIILLSDLPLDGTLKGIQLTQAAVGHEIGPFGAQFIAFCILLFAFSSIVGNYSYCETNLFFISRHPAGLQIYRIAVGGMVFFGSVAGLDIVWNLADLFYGPHDPDQPDRPHLSWSFSFKSPKKLQRSKTPGYQKPGIQSQRYPGNRRPTF